MLPPLNTPIARNGSPECPVHPETRVTINGKAKVTFAGYFDWTKVTTYTIIARAPADRIAELEAVLELYEDALTEAEAIFGGEYGDHYGPMCEMAFKARDARTTLKGSTP